MLIMTTMHFIKTQQAHYPIFLVNRFIEFKHPGVILLTKIIERYGRLIEFYLFNIFNLCELFKEL